MKSYFSFVERDGKFEIMENKGLSKKVTEFNLRNNGFKVVMTLSDKMYKKYQLQPPCNFFGKYHGKFSMDREKIISEKMFDIKSK